MGVVVLVAVLAVVWVLLALLPDSPRTPLLGFLTPIGIVEPVGPDRQIQGQAAAPASAAEAMLQQT